jgi:hypothetical protein
MQSAFLSLLDKKSWVQFMQQSMGFNFCWWFDISKVTEQLYSATLRTWISTILLTNEQPNWFRNRLFVSENAIIPGCIYAPSHRGLFPTHDWCLCVMWARDVIGKPSQRSRVVVAPESFQCRSKVVVVGTSLWLNYVSLLVYALNVYSFTYVA